jgi:hypothetical protein
MALWANFIEQVGARTVAEVGVYRGEFAEHVLHRCPGIQTYYMIDPWHHLDDWNKPANRPDGEFERLYDEVMEKTKGYERKRVVLRGKTTEVIDRIPNGELDLAYVDGDHTLRGVAIDLIRVYPKIREGGWIAGDDFDRSIWEHGSKFEPTLVFPFAVYFAEAVGTRIYALPHRQFLIHKHGATGFQFVDLTGKFGATDLRSYARQPLLDQASRLLNRRLRRQ